MSSNQVRINIKFKWPSVEGEKKLFVESSVNGEYTVIKFIEILNRIIKSDPSNYPIEQMYLHLAGDQTFFIYENEMDIVEDEFDEYNCDIFGYLEHQIKDNNSPYVVFVNNEKYGYDADRIEMEDDELFLNIPELTYD